MERRSRFRRAICTRGTTRRPTSSSAPYFDDMVDPKTFVKDLNGLRVLAVLGDSVTTDHISPAGNIAKDSPAAQYLMSLGVKPADFNSYGARRGNHEVMVRGTFANIRLRNLMAPGTEGGWTKHVPTGEQMSIYDASMQYQKEGMPLLVIAGKEYGTGSSRDWAAKGTLLLGVKAVIAESFERIHRSNLVGHGRAAAAICRRAESRIAGPDGLRDVFDRGHSGRGGFGRQDARESNGDADGKQDVRSAWCASIRRRKPNTTATAAFCRTCCGSWRRNSRYFRKRTTSRASNVRTERARVSPAGAIRAKGHYN